MKAINLPMPESTELETFEALYARHHRMVRAVVFHLSGAMEIDDLVQETFVRIWKGLSSFRGSSSAKTWIYRIAVNAALDHGRKARRWKFGLLKETMPDPKNHEQGAVEKELVRKGLSLLSEEHRAVVVLHHFEGLSTSEISEILEIPEGTARSRLYYAKTALLEFLKKQGVSL